MEVGGSSLVKTKVREDDDGGAPFGMSVVLVAGNVSSGPGTDRESSAPGDPVDAAENAGLVTSEEDLARADLAEPDCVGNAVASLGGDAHPVRREDRCLRGDSCCGSE